MPFLALRWTRSYDAGVFSSDFDLAAVCGAPPGRPGAAQGLCLLLIAVQHDTAMRPVWSCKTQPAVMGTRWRSKWSQLVELGDRKGVCVVAFKAEAALSGFWKRSTPHVLATSLYRQQLSGTQSYGCDESAGVLAGPTLWFHQAAVRYSTPAGRGSACNTCTVKATQSQAADDHAHGPLVAAAHCLPACLETVRTNLALVQTGSSVTLNAPTAVSAPGAQRSAAYDLSVLQIVVDLALSASACSSMITSRARHDLEGKTMYLSLHPWTLLSRSRLRLPMAAAETPTPTCCSMHDMYRATDRCRGLARACRHACISDLLSQYRKVPALESTPLPAPLYIITT